MLSSGKKCYHLGRSVIIWEEMLSSGAIVIIWDEMLSSGTTFYHLGAMLSSGANVIIWDEMLSSGMKLSCGTKCYHL
jgi:hypothetical protein